VHGICDRFDVSVQAHVGQRRELLAQSQFIDDSRFRGYDDCGVCAAFVIARGCCKAEAKRAMDCIIELMSLLKSNDRRNTIVW
jgi:hypothetical protein